MISGSSGPINADVKYCVKVKDADAINTGKNVSRTPRIPSIKNTIKNGTKSVTGGSICPIIAEIKFGSTPTALPRAIIGMPTAPNATGAVFAIIQSPAA